MGEDRRKRNIFGPSNPQLTVITEARISIVFHDGHKSSHPCDRPDFTIFGGH